MESPARLLWTLSDNVHSDNGRWLDQNRLHPQLGMGTNSRKAAIARAAAKIAKKKSWSWIVALLPPEPESNGLALEYCCLKVSLISRPFFPSLHGIARGDQLQAHL